MGKKWYYDAFISYRHTENDSFVAKNLHKQLESFKLPGNVARRLKENEHEAKTRITRVFRDQEELPLVSNLADPIMEALEKSEFLIVICSPRLKESMWCKKEIETFISLRGREHVLLVLTEGEPSDSFPEELLYREETVTADDGSTIIKKVPAEPLAADVRGHSRKEILKKIKSEILRLAAPMFGCGYDDLRQRHREQKMHKIIGMSLVGSAVCLLFGLVSMTMALRISRQNVQISEQLEEIEQQSEEIAMQAEEIEKQYAEAVRSNCISLAKESANLLEKGDRIAAIETALQAFPGDSNEDIPYTPQAAYALTESLNIYKNGTKILPDRILEADTNINFMKISPEGSKIITVDDFKMLCVWDSRSGSKLTSFLLNMNLYHEEDAIAFIDEDKFLYLTENGVSCFDISQGADIYQIDCEVVLEVCYSKDIDRAVISTDEGFLVISGRSGEVTASGSWQENENLMEMETEACAVMNADGTLFAASAASEEEQIIFVCETQTGEVYRRYNIANGSVKCMKFADDILYVADNNRWKPGTSFLADLGSTVYACDLSQDNALLWTYRNDKDWVNKIAVSSKEGSNYIICASYDYAVVLDKRDGGYIENFNLGSEIVEIGNYIGRDAFMVFTRDGTWIHLNLDSMMAVVGLTFTDCNSTNVKSFGIGNDFYTTLPYLDKNVTLYRWAAGSSLETLCETKNRYSDAVLSKDGKYLAVRSYSDEYNICVEMIDTDTCEVLWSYLGDEFFVGMSFYSEEEALTLVTSDDSIIMFDIKTGEQRAFYEEDSSFGRYLRTDVTGRYVVTNAYRKLNVYDMADGSLSYEIMGGEILPDSSAVAVSSSVKYLAISSKTSDSLQLYAVDALREGEVECLCEVENINATYIENLFFSDREEYGEGLALYVVYKNGDIKIYGVDTQKQKLYEDGGLEDLHNCMAYCICPENADYGVIVRDNCAYLIKETALTDFSGRGEIIAHIDGFLAVDGNRNSIYLTDRTHIYRVNIYDEVMLREEAERQLGIIK